MATRDISLTARYTAAAWAHLGLPFAERFADWRGKALLHASLLGGKLLPGRIGNALLEGQLAPRHLFMDEYIRLGGYRQVIEIAAGYSPRGLMFANEGIRYVEVDLPDVSAEKAALCQGDSKRPIFLGVSVTAPDFVERVLAVCDPALPTVIVNEGMSMYFSRPNYVNVLRNVGPLAEKLNAVFLTDFIRGTRGISWLSAWTEVGRRAVWLIADEVHMYAKGPDDIRRVFAEAGWSVSNIFTPAKEKKYTLGHTAAVTDFLYVVEASPSRSPLTRGA